MHAPIRQIFVRDDENPLFSVKKCLHERKNQTLQALN